MLFMKVVKRINSEVSSQGKTSFSILQFSIWDVGHSLNLL